jgi:hypothetical protein
MENLAFDTNAFDDLRSAQMRRLAGLKRYLLICMLWPTLAWADAPKPLLQIFRDVPEVQDDFMIWSYPDRDELSVTSNAFFLPRQEFGRYVRPPTNFAAKVEELYLSGADFKKPESRTWDFSGWHAIINGEELDASDPRYRKTFALIIGEIKRSGWRRKDVTIAPLKRGLRLQVTQLQYLTNASTLSRPHIVRGPTLFGLEACPNVRNDHLVCHLPHGFIFLAKPGETYR